MFLNKWILVIQFIVLCKARKSFSNLCVRIEEKVKGVDESACRLEDTVRVARSRTPLEEHTKRMNLIGPYQAFD